MCPAQYVITGVRRIRRQGLLPEICPRTTFATIGLFLQQSPQYLDDGAHRCPFLLHYTGQVSTVTKNVPRKVMKNVPLQIVTLGLQKEGRQCTEWLCNMPLRPCESKARASERSPGRHALLSKFGAIGQAAGKGALLPCFVVGRSLFVAGFI